MEYRLEYGIAVAAGENSTGFAGVSGRQAHYA